MRPSLLLRNAQPGQSVFRRFMNGRNDVIAKQRALQAEKDVPVYLRGNGKIYWKAYCVAYGITTVLTVDQLYKLLKGAE